MFFTAYRLAAVAFAQLRGTRINPRAVQQLVADARETLQELGPFETDAQTVLASTFGEAERREYQLDSLRRTIRRLRATSPFYRDLFAEIHPAKLTLEQFKHIPLTHRADLKALQRFLASPPFLISRTTGTTGSPVTVGFSAYECSLWPALAALAMLLRNECQPGDNFQFNTRLSATATQHHSLEMCRLLGVTAHSLGIISPDASIDNLLRGDRHITHLYTYPSYLGRLVTAAGRRGLSPRDFHLRIIQVVGEVLSPTLAASSQRVFGLAPIDTYSSTEIPPIAGRTCNRGHLHFDEQLGLVETCDLRTDGPARPGAFARLVVTSFVPYRVCMPLARYDTEDIVAVLPETPFDCDLASLPATSLVHGKAQQLLLVEGAYLTPRQIVTAVEAISDHLPGRYGARVGPHGLELILSQQLLENLTEAEILRHLHSAGIPAQHLIYRPEDEMARIHPLRADMVEPSFSLGQKEEKEGCLSKASF